MKLSDLHPEFIRRGEEEATTIRRGVLFEEAQGILFDCPAGDGHAVILWFADRNVPADEVPRPRWRVTGSGFDDLSLSPSIDMPNHWHGFLTNGEAKIAL